MGKGEGTGGFEIALQTDGGGHRRRRMEAIRSEESQGIVVPD